MVALLLILRDCGVYKYFVQTLPTIRSTSVIVCMYKKSTEPCSSEIFNLKRKRPRNLREQIRNFHEEVVRAGCNMFRANCQSKYRHCGGSLQSCAEKNIRFDCKTYQILKLVEVWNNLQSPLWHLSEISGFPVERRLDGEQGGEGGLPAASIPFPLLLL